MNTRTAQPFRRALPAVAGAVTLLALGACNKGTTPVGAAPTLTVASTPASTPSPTISPSTTTPTPLNIPACTTADLVARPTESDGAMGSVGYDVTMANHGKPCSLSGPPVVWYTDAHGALHKLPETVDDDSKARVAVRSGGTADFGIEITNGYGGYNPGSPECAHPYTYRGLSLQVAGGRVAIPDLLLDVKCGDISVGGWQRS